MVETLNELSNAAAHCDTHLNVEAIVLRECTEQLIPELSVQQHDAHAVADSVAEVKPASALLRQRDQIAQALPLEFPLMEEHLQQRR